MQRGKTTISAKNPSGDGESGNGDSEGLEAQRNERSSGDAVASAAEASSCHRQSLRRHAGNVRARLDQLARLRTLVQQVADERVNVRNLKNQMLTLQDENVQLKMALNRELKKVETLWNETEERKRPPGMSPPRPAPRPAPRLSLHNTVNCQHCSHPVPRAALPLYMDDVANAGMARHVSSILPFIMPWNMNENDILDLEAFQENLQQYISYRRASLIEDYIDRNSASSSLVSFGGALGTNSQTHAQRSQWRDQHRQRQQTERQQRKEQQIGQCAQEKQQAERQAPRQQRQQQHEQQQRQHQFLLQQQRSHSGCLRTRREEQSVPARVAATSKNYDAEREQRAGQDRGSQGDDVTELSRRRRSNAENVE